MPLLKQGESKARSNVVYELKIFALCRDFKQVKLSNIRMSQLEPTKLAETGGSHVHNPMLDRIHVAIINLERWQTVTNQIF
jgi:hypothetical protein